MEITQEHKKKMEDIMVNMAIGSVKCKKEFQCYKSSLEELCPVKCVIAFETVRCMDKNAERCGFSYGFVEERYCHCPLRIYIAEHFRR